MLLHHPARYRSRCCSPRESGLSNSHGGPKFINDDGEESPKRGAGPLSVWGYLYRFDLVLAHHPTPEAITEREFVLKGKSMIVVYGRTPAGPQRGPWGRGHRAGKLISIPATFNRACSYIAGSLAPRLFPLDRVATIPLQIDCECKKSIFDLFSRYVDLAILNQRSSPCGTYH